MPFKVGTDVVITDNKHLNGIADTDDTTKTTINAAILAQNNSLEILDSNGTTLKKIFGAIEAS